MKNKDEQELLDTMVESLVNDVVYQFNLSHDHEAVTVIKKSLERLEKDI